MVTIRADIMFVESAWPPGIVGNNVLMAVGRVQPMYG
jgi:hypothetical protein